MPPKNSRSRNRNRSSLSEMRRKADARNRAIASRVKGAVKEFMDRPIEPDVRRGLRAFHRSVREREEKAARLLDYRPPTKRERQLMEAAQAEIRRRQYEVEQDKTLKPHERQLRLRAVAKDVIQQAGEQMGRRIRSDISLEDPWQVSLTGVSRKEMPGSAEDRAVREMEARTRALEELMDRVPERSSGGRSFYNFTPANPDDPDDDPVLNDRGETYQQQMLRLHRERNDVDDEL